MKELSIFIDESGDFGKYNRISPYYIIGMVLHDQSNDIANAINHLDRSLSELNFRRKYIHVGPLIRRESEYSNLNIEERIRILRKLLNFVSHIEFRYKIFLVEKKHIKSEAELAEKLSKKVASFIREKYDFFSKYESIKIYYDNGQVEVTKILIAVFTTALRNSKLKKAYPKDYKMLQVADLVCTTALIEKKMKNGMLSNSERRVLGSDRDIRKMLLKPLNRKKIT